MELIRDPDFCLGIVNTLKGLRAKKFLLIYYLVSDILLLENEMFSSVTFVLINTARVRFVFGIMRPS